MDQQQTGNRLINFKHSERKRDQIRIVDELPDEIYKDLIAGKSFVFRPLPEPTYQPKDEDTKEFKTEFAVAQKEDEVFLNKIKKMGDKYDGSSKESLEVERELKDRVRIKLKMKKDLLQKLLDYLSMQKNKVLIQNLIYQKVKKKFQKNIRIEICKQF